MSQMNLMGAICDAEVLKTHLMAADAAKDTKNLSRVEWGHIGRYFKAVARDTAARDMKKNKEDYISKSKDKFQKDHIFELQYFAVALLYTIAQVSIDDPNFWPEIGDITFAAKLANCAENLEYMTLANHTFKSGFFRAGSSPENDPIYQLQKSLLKEYLQNHTFGLSSRMYEYFKEIFNDNMDPHREFKLALIMNIFTTPWCTGNWAPYLAPAKVSPFSVNITLHHYVPNAWVDDNLFFRAGRLNGKKKMELDEK